MKTIGFIGTGNMGGALARATAKSGRAGRLLLANRSAGKAQYLARELGGEAVDNRRVAAEAEILFLGVKPQYLEEMLSGVRDVLAAREDRVVVVSMIAGWELSALDSLLGGLPVVRIMPNLPASVGGGVTLMCASPSVRAEEREEVKALLSASGAVLELDERLMDAAGGITGCGPAFVALFAEGLADGAVACGLPRADALRLAAETLAGTAKLLLETGEHPAVLKDRVCSPAGSTIQGVRALEERGFRAAAMNAVIAAFEKEF